MLFTPNSHIIRTVYAYWCHIGIRDTLVSEELQKSSRHKIDLNKKFCQKISNFCEFFKFSQSTWQIYTGSRNLGRPLNQLVHFVGFLGM